MPGLIADQIKVHLEDDNVLAVSGERRRSEKEEGAKYLRMERRVGKVLKKFVLPDNADKERVSAICEDGVLTVMVEKSPPPRPKTPRVIEVKAGGGGGRGVRHGGEGVEVKGGGEEKEGVKSGGRHESEVSHGGGGGGGGEEVKGAGWHESDGSHGESI
ncbi:hypothetical protein BUALT_Bualt05G0007400 [Buddleja alternifolia]|uniref:SHSP domain-containing protein n=1 Tax=Buddleja alternifolia TaxID=168488 RepID=A0AAV6XNE8_9LAMI|nr:hypothetical protein BUALT_Bualt05G0007400 [Buddleja alternifolia]